MEEHNPDPISEFVREQFRLAHAKDEVGGVGALEKRAGLGPGHGYNIKNKNSRVTSQTAQRVAVALGWQDYSEFIDAALKWWREDGQKRVGAWAFPDVPEASRDPELRVAIDMTKGGGGTVPEVVDEAIKKYRSEIGTGEHDRFWWVARFGESAAAWQKRQAAGVVEKKQTRKAARELARARREAPESSRGVAGKAPESPKSEPPPRVASVRGRRARRNS